MKPKNILRALNDIDYDIVNEAEMKKKSKNNIWLKLGAAAACFALVLGAGALLFAGEKGNITIIDGIERRYKTFTIADEGGMEWPWEYKTPIEKYASMVVDGVEYRTRAQKIREELLGEPLEIGTAEGYDIYSDKLYTAKFEVRAIHGIEDHNVVAVNLDGSYVVFLKSDNPFPESLGEFFGTYSLCTTLPLGRFSAVESEANTSYYVVNNDDYIWQILSECADAPRISDDLWNRPEKYLSFTATSEELGIYKKALYVTEDGYLWTNAMEYAYVFDIGTSAAGKIITYAMENSEKTVFEPYVKSIAGTVCEIGEGYILVDDSILCTNENDGIVFKVLTDDPRVSRCFDWTYGRIHVGDAVNVEYKGTVDASMGYVVYGAFNVSRGSIVDGDMLILE